jgi:hypothetical protein
MNVLKPTGWTDVLKPMGWTDVLKPMDLFYASRRLLWFRLKDV